MKNKVSAGSFILPGLFGFLLFYIAPFILSLGYSFLDSPLKKNFVGLANYLDIFKNPAYLLGLKNTLRFIAVSVPLNMLISLGVALLFKASKNKYKSIFTLAFLIALVLPSGSISFFWTSLFSLDGALNGLLNTFGILPMDWLGSSKAFFVMVFIFLWKNIGYNMILYQTGLSSIPPEEYEAGRLDGGNPLQLFYHITLPNLRSTTVLVLVMSIINSFKVFKEIFLITGSYPNESIYTLQHFMNNMFGNLNYSRLTTATTLFTLLIILITQGLFALERKGEG